MDCEWSDCSSDDILSFSSGKRIMAYCPVCRKFGRVTSSGLKDLENKVFVWFERKDLILTETR